MTPKLPPQSIDAEKGVLGCIMLDKDGIFKVVDILDAEDFYRVEHRKIFEGMIDLFRQGQSIDLLTLSQKLGEKKDLENVGGYNYLAELLNMVPTPAHIMEYANIVRSKKILRDLISAGQQIESMGYDEEQDINITLDHASQKVFEIAQGSLSRNFVEIKNDLEAAFDRIDKIQATHGIRGITSGFASMDNILAGLQSSDLLLLAARPSLGKTSLALNMARFAAEKTKKPVGIFSLEMSREQLIDRLISSEAGINLWKLRTGRLSSKGQDNDYVKINRAIATLSEAPIFIEDTPSPTVLQMRALARRLQIERGDLGLLIIDYLQLIQPRNPSENLVQQVSEISRELKGLARELNIPVLALSQLSRAVEQRPNQIPKLSDLRESGSLEQDADVVMFIYREDKVKKNSSRPNIAKILIAKHRNGPVGEVELYFDPETASFRELAQEYSEDSPMGSEGVVINDTIVNEDFGAGEIV